MRLNLRHQYSACAGHRFVTVYSGGKRVGCLVRGLYGGSKWRVTMVQHQLPNHGKFERRGDALRAIRVSLMAEEEARETALEG